MRARHGTGRWNLGAWTVLGLAAIVACAGVSACADKNALTPTAAEAVIRAALGYNGSTPKNDASTPLTLFWVGVCNGERVNPCNAGALDTETQSLISDGLVSMTFDGATSRMSLTAKGQQYADGAPKSTMMDDAHGSGPREYRLQNVWISTLEFGAVTGVQESTQLKTATVAYTLIRKATPFGNRPLGNSIVYGNHNDVAAGTLNRTATFTLGDDGWKIAK